MFKKILLYGLAAGLLAGVLVFALVVEFKGPPPRHGIVMLDLILLLALTPVFIGIKRWRDVDQGGTVRLWPAFALGLGISLVAGLVYAMAWQATLALSTQDFGTEWVQIHMPRQSANGLSEADLARLAAETDQFKARYANPLYRFGVSLWEILPIGLLVSLLSAALLRNPRFFASRRG